MENARSLNQGVRVVGLVKKYLKSHLKQNSGDGYIFHAASNSQKPIIFEHIVWDVVIPATKKAGIEWHGIHAFRRGLASVLHDLNSSELIISHILRHSTKSSKSVAAKHYIKPSLKLMREALEKVEAKYKTLEKKRARL